MLPRRAGCQLVPASHAGAHALLPLTLGMLLCLAAPIAHTQQADPNTPPPAPRQGDENPLKKQAQAAYDRGTTLARQNRFEDALASYHQALDLFTKIDRQQDIGRTLNNIGAVYNNQGQFDRALDHFLRALVIKEKLDTPRNVAVSLNNLGVVYDSLGQSDKALDYYQQSLDLYEKLDNAQDRATSLNNLGLAAFHLGRYDRALDCQSRALTLFINLKNPKDIATCLSNLGAIYTDLGQHEKAKDQYQQALEIYNSRSSQKDIAKGLANLGIACRNLGQNDKALEFSDRALALYEQLGMQQEIARSLNTVGNLYRDQNRLDKALEYHQRALTLCKRQDSPQEIALTLDNLNDDYSASAQWDKALDAAIRSLDIAEKLGSTQSVALSLDRLGEAYSNLGQLDKAEVAYSRALAKYEDISRIGGEPTDLVSYQERLRRFYPHYARLLIQRSLPERALEMLERGKMQGLARRWASNLPLFTQGFAADDRQELQQLTLQLTVANHIVRSVQDRLNAAPTDRRSQYSKPLDEAHTARQETERKMTELLPRLYAKYPHFREVSGAESPDFARLKTRLTQSHPDALYLEWGSVDDKTTLLFALSGKAGLHAFLLPVGAQTLQRQAEAWRELLKTSNQNNETSAAPKAAPDLKEQELSHVLYAELLAPLEQAALLPKGNESRLVLVADGPLLDLAFASLQDKTDKRLRDRFTITTAFSFSSLAASP